jgi:hypothetical protein
MSKWPPSTSASGRPGERPRPHSVWLPRMSSVAVTGAVRWSGVELRALRLELLVDRLGPGTSAAGGVVREFVQQPSPRLDRTHLDALGRIRTMEQGLCRMLHTDSDLLGPFFFA